MNYLKEYNINDEQIRLIVNKLKDCDLDIDLFDFDSDKVIEILELFKSIGINNFYEIIINKPFIFYEPLPAIKERINNYTNKDELRDLINENVENLNLIGY